MVQKLSAYCSAQPGPLLMICHVDRQSVQSSTSADILSEQRSAMSSLAADELATQTLSQISNSAEHSPCASMMRNACLAAADNSTR